MSKDGTRKRRTASAKKTPVRQILDQMWRTFSPFLTKSQPRERLSRALLMLSKFVNRDVLQDDSLIRAKLAARLVQETGDLDFSIWLVLLAIERNDKRFFIDFGKCLSGEIKDSTLFDKRDRDIAEIVLFDPQFDTRNRDIAKIVLFDPEMSAKDAVRELERRGHRGITEDNFRMWKMRLLKVKRKFDVPTTRKA